MLNSISWQDFLTVVATVVGLYYFISTLLLYQAEILQLIRGKSAQNLVRTHGGTDTPRLIGATRKRDASEDGKQTVGSEELIVNSTKSGVREPEQSAAPAEDSAVMGTVADFLEESKTLAALVAERKGHKEDCVVLFRSLLERYPKLIGSAYQDGIAVSLHHTLKEVCGFQFAEAEINSWWPRTN